MTKYAAAENTKRKMIEAAGELAAEVGLDNVSTRAVAEASGENIGSIHYHFGGKSGLFEAVVRDAIECCHVKLDDDAIDRLGESPEPSDLSAAIRELVSREIHDMFLSDRPFWHSQVIYQLLQRDDALYNMFREEVLDPSMDAMCRFFRLIDANLTDDEVFLHTALLKMPVFAHANYRKAMLKRLGADAYAPDYLKRLEDLLVKQTQLVLGLPLDSVGA